MAAHDPGLEVAADGFAEGREFAIDAAPAEKAEMAICEPPFLRPPVFAEGFDRQAGPARWRFQEPHAESELQAVFSRHRWNA
jgi:hypothetical protein